jgi:hypothetical protein
MNSRSPPVVLAAALRDPSATFSAPEDVLRAPELTREQKIRVLKLWEHDAAEAEVATEEGMPGGEQGLLSRILLALQQLEGRAGEVRTDPSKQHSLL